MNFHRDYEGLTDRDWHHWLFGTREMPVLSKTSLFLIWTGFRRLGLFLIISQASQVHFIIIVCIFMLFLIAVFFIALIIMSIWKPI